MGITEVDKVVKEYMQKNTVTDLTFLIKQGQGKKALKAVETTSVCN